MTRTACGLAFTNPSTSTRYRLVLDPAGWRVTKSTAAASGGVSLAHLRGVVGPGPVDQLSVDQLVAGSSSTAVGPCPPDAVFAAVVLRDIDATADVLTAIAREAADVCSAGCPGFRPGCPPLRRQRDAALARAVAECRAMADAWRISGFAAPGGSLPAWLSAALADR